MNGKVIRRRKIVEDGNKIDYFVQNFTDFSLIIIVKIHTGNFNITWWMLF